MSRTKVFFVYLAHKGRGEYTNGKVFQPANGADAILHLSVNKKSHLLSAIIYSHDYYKVPSSKVMLRTAT